MTEDNKDELENVLMINFKESNKKSKKDNRKSKKGVSVRAKTPLNKIVNNPSLKSPTNKEGMKDRRKSAQVNSKPKS